MTAPLRLGSSARGLGRVVAGTLLAFVSPAVSQARTVPSGPVFVTGGHFDPVRRVADRVDAAAALRALLAGPTAAEWARGVYSSIPRGVRLVGLEPWRGPTGRGLRAVFDERFLTSPSIEVAVEQVTKTLEPHATDIAISIADDRGTRRALADCLPGSDAALPHHTVGPKPPARPTAVRGVLTGKRIAVSPGHGFYWHPSLGWTTQRGNIGGLIEDIHTNEIAMRYLIPYLENMGAEVFSCRDFGEVRGEHVADDDNASSGFQQSGSWTRSSFTGYKGGGYRYTVTGPRSTSVCTWIHRVRVSGYYPVFVYFRAGTNRSRDARYRVTHAGGTEAVRIDQTENDRVWHVLGTWWFEAGSTARVQLDNQSSSSGKVVIADAVRFGNGFGSVSRGSGTSGQQRWRECSRYWAMFQGAPSSIWNSSSGNDHSDDVTCRPRYSEWRGADCYISLHTNAGGGAGTSSYIHSTSPTTGSAALQRAVQAQVVGDIRRHYDSSWTDRGRRSANFGELRLLRTMPGVLLELAFHDRDRSKDHNAIHDPDFRRIGARAYARGVLRYFAPSAPFPPTRPEALRVVADRRGGLRVAWDAVPGATSYTVERAPDGKSFVEVARVTGRSWATSPLPHGTVASFRVRAWNASGRSFPSEVLAARTSHRLRSDVLLVEGFDRLGKTVKGPENTRDYLRQHADGLARHGAWSLGFDAVSNEALLRGRVALGGYRAVLWAAGEESTVDESFSSAEQSLVRAYLARGGSLLVSGSEVGWDLDAKGSASDRAFFRQTLGVRYVRDDAATYAFRAVAGGLFAGLPSGTFDNGTGTTYDVDYPDVLAPADSRSMSWLEYANSSGSAAIARDDGTARVLVIGFPLETIRDAGLRSRLLERAIPWLLRSRTLEMPSTVAVGSSASIFVRSPSESRQVYVLAASGTTRPGLQLPDRRTLPFALDALFTLSVGANNGVFQGFAGLLDARGNATARVRIPNDSGLRGVRMFVSGLTLRASPPAGPLSVYPWYRLTIR